MVASKKLSLMEQIRNPGMFPVYVSAVLTSVLSVLSVFGISNGIVSSGFIFTIAEGRGKAQADTLRANRTD